MADEFEGGGSTTPESGAAPSGPPAEAGPAPSDFIHGAAGNDEFESDGDVQTPPAQSKPQPDPSKEQAQQAAQQTADKSQQQPVQQNWSQAHVEWGKHLGVPPEIVDAMDRNGTLQKIAAAYEAQQRFEAAQKQPAQQQTPAPEPTVTPPVKFEWSEEAMKELHPDFAKYSEYQESRIAQLEKQFQKAMDERLAQIEPRLQKFEPLVAPLSGLLEHQRLRQREADERAYEEALGTLNAPDILGTKGQWNTQALQTLGPTVQAMLQSGRAKNIPEAVTKAFRAEFGDRLQAQTVKQVANATKERREMVTGSPTAREGAVTPERGEKAAFEHMTQWFRENRGYTGKVDPDYLDQFVP